MKTPYDVLGVPRDASDEAIRIAFRRAVKACHPDLNAGDAAAEEQLKEVIAAYEVLKTPQQRADYDELLAAYNRYRTSVLSETVREFARPGAIGVLSGSAVALVIWLSLSLSNRPETSDPPPTPRVATAQVSPSARQQVGAVDDRSGREKGDGVRESRWAAAAPQPHLQQSARNLQPTADPPATQVLLAREWEQVLSKGDPIAIRDFVERHPRAPESEIARSRLMAVIDSAEDVLLLQSLSSGATDAIVERAQQRLARLRQLTVAKEDSRAVPEDGDHPDDGSSSRDLAFYLVRGERRVRGGDFDLAIADFGQAIALKPDNALGYHLRGNAWSGKGELDRALVDYDVAINFEPNNPALLRDRGIVWRRRGELDRALVDFDYAIRLGFSDASAYNERGQVWHEKKRYERAIADFNQALKINPNLASALVNRGIAWRSNGDLDRAIADFDQAIGIDPNMPAAYYNRAQARSDRHEFERAATDHAKARELLANGAADSTSVDLR